MTARQALKSIGELVATAPELFHDGINIDIMDLVKQGLKGDK